MSLEAILLGNELFLIVVLIILMFAITKSDRPVPDSQVRQDIERIKKQISSQDL